MQNWTKQGLIYGSRAQCPTILKLTENGREIWRIFFADRNIKGQSFIRYIDVNPENPKEILHEEKHALLPYGPPGSFDHSGIMPTSVIQTRATENRTIYYLFYIGWSQRLDVPYHNAIGLAASYDGKNFFKIHQGPVIGTSKEDPFFTGTACVIKGGSIGYECYYLSATGWESDGSKLEPTYNIKRAVSMGNPSMWILGGKDHVVVDYASPDEGGICNAAVYMGPDRIRHLWYCYRKKFDYRTNKENSYRIGYTTGRLRPATTWEPGKFEWVRKDQEVNLQLSETGWDSDMMCYPAVIEHKNNLYMFYNGNGFGQSGFGYATLELPAQKQERSNKSDACASD